MLIALAIGIYTGTVIGASSREHRDALEDIRQYHEKPAYLLECADRQLHINVYRQQLLSLEPLTHGDICQPEVPKYFIVPIRPNHSISNPSASSVPPALG